MYVLLQCVCVCVRELNLLQGCLLAKDCLTAALLFSAKWALLVSLMFVTAHLAQWEMYSNHISLISSCMVHKGQLLGNLSIILMFYEKLFKRVLASLLTLKLF